MIEDRLTFEPGVLGTHDSIKGFRVLATDGSAGRVSWASYKPGESYVVVTLGLLGRKHHVVPARAVSSVGEGEVRVALTRAQIGQLPDLPHPRAAVDDEKTRQLLASFERAAHEWPMSN